MKMDKHRVEQVVRILKNLDVNDEDVHIKARQLWLSMGQLHSAIGTLGTDHSLCRTRTHFEPVLFTDVKEIGIPGSGHVKSYGRCNRIQCPVFYCSDELRTSYSELAYDWLKNCPDGSCLYATVSTWKTIRDTNVVIIASPDTEKRITPFDKHFGARLDEVNASLGEVEREGAIAYQRFLYEVFSKPGKENVLTYIITSAYTELALEAAKEKADGIVYPCVPMQGIGLNYALRPEYFNSSNLVLQNVSRRKVRRRDVPNDLPELKEIEIVEACSDFSTGAIYWCCHEPKALE